MSRLRGGPVRTGGSARSEGSVSARSLGTGAAGWDSRVAARNRLRRRARLTATLTVLSLLLIVAAGSWVLLGTSVLGVRDVQVSGTDRLAPAEVLAAADVRGGTPLARLDITAVAARVRALPEVRAVAVHRSWPGTVQLVVQERTAAAVRASGPSFLLVDRSGVTFATVARRPAGLPMVSAPVDAGPAALRAAMDVLDALPRSVRPQVRQVRATSPDDVRVELTRGRTVTWGSTDRGRRKAAVLAALVSRPAGVYDVSAPDAPTTRR